MSTEKKKEKKKDKENRADTFIIIKVKTTNDSRRNPSA